MLDDYIAMLVLVSFFDLDGTVVFPSWFWIVLDANQSTAFLQANSYIIRLLPFSGCDDRFCK
jgi:hypothetical protein